jgi:hypothetical protein
MELHVHVYDQSGVSLDSDDNLVMEKDLELIDIYSDYDQYGFEYDGKWVEIRVKGKDRVPEDQFGDVFGA